MVIPFPMPFVPEFPEIPVAPPAPPPTTLPPIPQQAMPPANAPIGPPPGGDILRNQPLDDLLGPPQGAPGNPAQPGLTPIGWEPLKGREGYVDLTKPGGRTRDLGQVNSIILHDRGGNWPGEGGKRPYHFEVLPNGQIMQNYELNQIAPHAYKSNPNSVGVAYAGKVGATPTTRGMESLRYLTNKLREAYPDWKMQSHGEAYQATRGGPLQASRSGRGPEEASWRHALNQTPNLYDQNNPAGEIRNFAPNPSPGDPSAATARLYRGGATGPAGPAEPPVPTGPGALPTPNPYQGGKGPAAGSFRAAQEANSGSTETPPLPTKGPGNGLGPGGPGGSGAPPAGGGDPMDQYWAQYMEAARRADEQQRMQQAFAGIGKAFQGMGGQRPSAITPGSQRSAANRDGLNAIDFARLQMLDQGRGTTPSDVMRKLAGLPLFA